MQSNAVSMTALAVPPMPTYSIDPLYPHWFRCDLCGQDVAEVLPAEALDLVNLTPPQLLELCPDAEAEIDGHEHGCPRTARPGTVE